MLDGFSSLHEVDLSLDFEISLFQKKNWSGKFDNSNLLSWVFLTFAERKGRKWVYFQFFIFLYFKKFGWVVEEVTCQC